MTICLDDADGYQISQVNPNGGTSTAIYTPTANLRDYRTLLETSIETGSRYNADGNEIVRDLGECQRHE